MTARSEQLVTRRDFIAGAAAGALLAASPLHAAVPDYRGRNVIIARFGGGVRRRETIDPTYTCCPWFQQQLVPQGVLFPQMQIAELIGDDQIVTSHGEGTLYLLTGRYAKYKDVEARFLGARFEAETPTIFECFRRAYAVPPDQALLINGEDRTDEEFYTFSKHHLYGVEYRSSVLSLYRFKTWLLRHQLAADKFAGKERERQEAALRKLDALDYRVDPARRSPAPALDQFWQRWRQTYGDTGLTSPRGDRLLAELAIQAMTQLQPRLMMINFQDPDYVHWGNPAHYTRGIAVIDACLRRLWEAIQRLPFYRENTVFITVPDCGRDANRLMEVPYQHHFNSPSAREIFCLAVGPGVARGQTVDRTVDQTSVAATVGALMDFPMADAEGPALSEVFS